MRKSLYKLLPLLLLLMLTVKSKAFVVTDSILYARINESAEQIKDAIAQNNKTAEKDYLVLDENDITVYKEKWGNGGVDFLSAASKSELRALLNTFNTRYSKDHVTLYLFVGRYFLSYIDNSITDQALKIKLQNALKAETGNEAGKPDLTQARDALNKSLWQFVETSGDGGKTIMLVYMENLEAERTDDDIKFKKQYWYGILSDQLDKFLENKAKTLKTYLVDKKGIALTLPSNNSSNDERRTSLLKEGIKGLTELYQEGKDDYADAKEVIRWAWTLKEPELKALTVAERIKVLRTLNSVDLHDVNNVLTLAYPGFSGEEIALKMLKTAPLVQSKALIDSLGNNTKILTGLVSKLDDEGGYDNYTLFISELLKIFYSARKADGNISVVPERIFRYGGSDVINPVNVPGKGVITFFIPAQNPLKTYPTQEEYSPLAYISLVSRKELPFITDKETSGFYSASVPMFYLNWLFDKSRSQIKGSLISASISIPLNAFVFGAGANMLGSGSNIIKALGVFDMLSATTLTALDAGNIAAVVELKYGKTSEEAKVLRGVETALAIYNTARFVTDLTQATQKLDDATTIWKQRRTAMKQEGTLTEQQAKQLDEVLRSQSVGSLLGSIVKNGNKIEYTNPAGKLLKWSEQSAGDISNAINTSKSLPVEAKNIGRITESKVGEFVKGKKSLDGYGIKIKDETGQIAAELDVTTLDEIIEVKASFSSVDEYQFARLLNTSENRFVNPYQKKVILYIDKPLSEATQGQVNMINRVKGQGVTVVHSLEELGGALK